MMNGIKIRGILRYNNYEGNEINMLAWERGFTSTKRVMFVIKLIDFDKIEQFDHNKYKFEINHW